MMKNQLLAALTTVLLGSMTATQDTTSLPPPPEKDPFVGTWQANQEKSRPKLKERDALYRRTVEREEDVLVFSSQIGTSHGLSKHSFKIRCDGRFQRVPFGSLSCVYTGTNFIDGETKSTAGGIEYWSEEVSSDGQETKISAYKDKARMKLKSIWILDRVK